MERQTALVVSTVMAILVILVSGIGMFLAVYLDTDAPQSVVLAAVAMISFVGLMALTQGDGKRWELTEGAMRTAIAGTIVIVYLVLVGIVAFFKVGPKELPGISQTLVTNFTTIVGVVIAFYFGASAYVQARAKDGRSEGGVKP
jgi:hypothetical protein